MSFICQLLSLIFTGCFPGILCTNSFQLEDQECSMPSVSHVTSGVFLTAARINHSCRSNADYRVTREEKTGSWSISVILIRDVAEGEEITLCYNNFLEDDGPVTRRLFSLETQN